MKITEKQLEALQGLLPDNDVTDNEVGGLEFVVGSDKAGFRTDCCDIDRAIFCDLLKRAVLDIGEVSFVKVRTSRDWCTVDLLDYDNSGFDKTIVNSDEAPTELEAWILAVEQLHGRRK